MILNGLKYTFGQLFRLNSYIRVYVVIDEINIYNNIDTSVSRLFTYIYI